jgi:hypothetical protein
MKKADLVNELTRELNMRAKKYPEWIASDRLNREIAERRYRYMRYALQVLMGMEEEEITKAHKAFEDKERLKAQRLNAQQKLF